jgi:predicted PolB exonuclease-like 3'-5' exonuclease
MKIPQRKVHPDFCECDECNAKYNQPATSANSQTSIVFDIETIAQDEQKLLAIAPTFEPDSRLKDPEKITANIAMQKARYIERAALHWTTAQIVLIGVGDGEKYMPIIGTEKEVLKSFFDIVQNSIANGVNIGGHNVKQFDLPLIVNRARALKLTLPDGLLSFWRGRSQWHECIFDTLEIFSFGDRSRTEGNGVEDICRALGLNGKLGSGADFPALWKSNQKAAIAYNQRDIECEIAIAKTCGFKF